MSIIGADVPIIMSLIVDSNLVLGQFSRLDNTNVLTIENNVVKTNCSVTCITSADNNPINSKEEVSNLEMSVNYNSDIIS